MACVSLRCSSSHTLRSESIMLKSKHRTSYLGMIFEADHGAGRDEPQGGECGTLGDGKGHGGFRFAVNNRMY